MSPQVGTEGGSWPISRVLS